MDEASLQHTPNSYSWLSLDVQLKAIRFTKILVLVKVNTAEISLFISITLVACISGGTALLIMNQPMAPAACKMALQISQPINAYGKN